MQPTLSLTDGGRLYFIFAKGVYMKLDFIREKAKMISKRPFIIILGALLIVELFYLMKLNLYSQYLALDLDSSAMMNHLREMVKNGKLLISDWNYVSTLEIDSSMLLALPFYMLTKSMWISYALSNCIYILVLTFVVFWIFHNCRIKIEYALGVCCLLFVPYSFGMLAYVNMMFFRAAQYSVKVLVPLLGIALFSSNFSGGVSKI